MSVGPVPYEIDAPALRDRAIASGTRVRPLLTSLSLLLHDVIAITAAMALGIIIWRQVNPSAMLLNYLELSPVIGVLVLVYYFTGLYIPFGINPAEELKRTTQGIGAVCMVLSAGIFLSKDVGTYSRGVFIVSGVLSSIFVPAGRAFVRRTLGGKPWWGVPVLVLGAGKTGAALIDSLVKQPRLGLKPVVCLDDDESKHGYHSDVPVMGPLGLAPMLSSALSIRHAVIAMPNLDRQELMYVLARYTADFSYVIVIPNLFGMATLWVTSKDLGGVLGLEVRQNLLMPLNRCLKRVLDLTLASILGCLSFPVILVCAVIVKLISSGPAFYTQEREGEGGSRIRIRKLRTMHRNAQELLTRHLADSSTAREEWKRYCKLRNDPRIIPGIGRILRRTSIDELPQLWSVITGDMSLVGPRPFYKSHPFEADSEFRSLRARVKPGLTGLWQVTARSDGDIEIQKALDTYYIRNWSLWLDAHILVRTIRAVLFTDGAY